MKHCLALCLCLFLTGCASEAAPTNLLDTYTHTTGATMEANVICSGDNLISEFTLQCQYQAQGQSVVTVLAPDTMAGVQGILTAGEWVLEYNDMVFNVGTLSSQAISPLACLPLLMEGLSQGWVLEENTEVYQDIDCLRVTLDYADQALGSVVVTAWLSQDDGTPVGAEVTVDNARILQVLFTSFHFYDTLEAE